ncbi:MAG TPA: hypothetical protein VF159_04535 [Gemmatimonadaceae bacterium]
MKKHLTLAVAVAALAATAACNKSNEKTSADTTTVPGTDTVSGKALPTTDTVVKTTTTTKDTIQGEASDSAKAKADSLKEKKEGKKAKKY